jgi:hypothetical protein
MVAAQDGFGPTDFVLVVVGGGVGYLAKKAWQHFFPAQATPAEQIQNLIDLIEAGSRAGAKRMKFRLSANTSFGSAIGGMAFKVENNTDMTVDLEVEFS